MATRSWPINGRLFAPQRPTLPAFALTILEALLIGLAAVALARLVWALLTPAGPVGPQPVPAAPAAVSPDALAAFDPFFRTAPASGPAAVSSLDLTLVGTRVDQASGRGSAIITLPDDTQGSFAVGEEVMPGVRLASVNFDSVTLDNNGAREELFLDQSGPLPATTGLAPPAQPVLAPLPASPPAPSIGASAAAPAIRTSSTPILPPSRPRLAADIQAEPRIADGRITGFVLTPKGSGTAFAAAGLKPGDVLTQVDGTPVASLGDPAAITRRIDAGGVFLVIDRAGQPLAVQLPPQAASTAR